MDNKRLFYEMNKIANEIMYPKGIKHKGTSYWYTRGSVNNKSVCYTRAKTHYNGRYGFWSFIQTKFKNGMIKRTKFAKSGSRKKAEARAWRLLRELELKNAENDLKTFTP